MTKIIQMVKMSDDNFLFILGFDGSNLTFRTSLNIKHLQTESVEIEDDIVYTKSALFHILFLNNFLKLSE